MLRRTVLRHPAWRLTIISGLIVMCALVTRPNRAVAITIVPRYGAVVLNGAAAFADRAVVAGGLSQFGPNSKLLVSGQAEIAGPAEFQAGSAVPLPQVGDTLHLGGDTDIAAGAQFTGDGLLVNRGGAVLAIEDQAVLDVALRNEGVFAPGSSAGQVTVASFENATGGTLAIEIGGTRPGAQYDQLRVAAEVRLGGELNVALIDSFLPSANDTFTILTTAGISGQFDNAPSATRLDTLGGEGSFLVRYAQDGPNVTLSDFLALITGDMDCDGDVDFDDIAAFVFGLNDPAQYEALYGVPPTRKGDTDADGDLDFDDIDAFVTILSSSQLSEVSRSVPEPTTAGIALFCALMLAGRGWRQPRWPSSPPS